MPGPALWRTERTTMPHRPAAPATRLRRLRQSQHLTQAELADKAHVTPNRISDLESGSRSIEGVTVAVAHRLARALDCAIEDLI